ncbi:MAG: alpha-L-fucosidase, partial [Chlamydiia bacterium]|nr:alpha-L-fucosidase [Chlamydiia bacterium]
MKYINQIKYIFSLVVIISLSITTSFAQEKNKKKSKNKEKDEFQLYVVDKSIKVQTADEKSVEDWKDKRFGMFIHWGPISQMGQQLGHSRNSPSHHPGGKPYKVAKLEPEVYDVQYKTFNPTKYNPDHIVKLARSAGMEYLVFTAKHHGGFSMWDSKVTDYDMMSTPYKKDVLKELEKACRDNDFGFGFYYSPRDWHNPDCDSEFNHPRYIKFYKSQMEELLNNYGQIDEIWFDGLGPGKWGNTSEEVMNRIRTLQPGAMVNDRGGAGADFYTPEHSVGYFNNKENWESCQTTTGQWGYNPKVNAKKLPQLMEIMLYTWGADGNLLLNIGPMGDGSLNPQEVERLEQIAKWWKVNGDISIRSSRGGPYFSGKWGSATRKGNKAYLHIFRWGNDKELTFPNLDGRKIKSVKLLNGKDIKLNKGRNSYSIEVAESNREDIVTTVEVTFNKDIMDVNPILAQKPLTLDAKLSASHNEDELDNIRDQNANTYWHVKEKGTNESWIEV